MHLSKHKQEIINIIDNISSIEKKLQAICDYLKQEIDYFDWVGFYFKNGSKNELKLAQFAGEPTEHTSIPFGKGICGQVAVSNKNLVVQDVSSQNNYISCSINVKSGIVIPIFIDGNNIGQIDIDSHTINSFTDKDTHLLEFICQQVAQLNLLAII